MTNIVDLRSDTVTRPSPGMRAAMASGRRSGVRLTASGRMRARSAARAAVWSSVWGVAAKAASTASARTRCATLAACTIVARRPGDSKRAAKKRRVFAAASDRRADGIGPESQVRK